MDLPAEVLRLEAGAGGVAGGALGADTTFDKFSVGGGAFGPGDSSAHIDEYKYNTYLPPQVQQLQKMLTVDFKDWRMLWVLALLLVALDTQDLIS